MDVPIQRQVAGAVAAAGLAGAAGLHALWASGSPWPASGFDILADTVFGHRPFPSRAATWTVAALLATATATTAARSGLVPLRGARDAPIVRLGTIVVAGTLVVRGVVGAAVSARGIGGSTQTFRRWDLALYSPLCLALGLAAGFASRSDPST